MMPSELDAAPEPFARAILSAFSALVSELNKRGQVATADVVQHIQGGASEHRSRGNPIMAGMLDAIADSLLMSVPERPIRKN